MLKKRFLPAAHCGRQILPPLGLKDGRWPVDDGPQAVDDGRRAKGCPLGQALALASWPHAPLVLGVGKAVGGEGRANRTGCGKRRCRGLELGGAHGQPKLARALP